MVAKAAESGMREMIFSEVPIFSFMEIANCGLCRIVFF